MKKEKLPKPQKPLITELAFRLILDSEETEGFRFKIISKGQDGKSKYVNVEKNVILEFLEDAFTKVSVKKDSSGFLHLLASNSISNETVKIEGLADHYLTLLDVVDRAAKKRSLLSKNKEPLITHEFIKEINLSLQTRRYGEVAIGQYREYDFLGRWLNVHITDVNEEGEERPICSIPLCHAMNVQSEMDKVVDFANSIPERFAKGEDIMKLVAQFHAMFIKTHPFRDGNGRTARLLTNFILLSLGQKITSIPIQDKNDYILALDYANSENIQDSAKEITKFPQFLSDYYYSLNPDKQNVSQEEIMTFMKSYRNDNNKYDKLAKCFQEHQIKLTTKQVVAQILNNYGQKNIGAHIKIGPISATQVDFENF